MTRYVLIESRDPFADPAVEERWTVATRLADRGHDVTYYLVQNGVLAARAGARTVALEPTAGVTVLADDLSLAERGIPHDALKEGIQPADIGELTDRLLQAGCKPVWT